MDAADPAQAAVAEAERLAAKEEAMLSSSDNSASPAKASTSDDAASGRDALVTKQVAAAKGTASVGAKQRRASERITSPRLQITIVSARGLKGSLAGGVTSMGVTDPYCVCEVLRKPRRRFQTMAIDGTDGPHWNHSGTLDGFGAADSVHFSVFDRDALPDQRLLGSATLPVWRIGKAGFRGELPLPGAGRDGDTAFLKLAVEREGPGWEAAAWKHLADQAREAAKEAQEDAQATEDAADAEDDDDDDEDDDEDEHDAKRQPSNHSGTRVNAKAL